LNCECHEDAPNFSTRFQSEADVIEALELGEVKMMFRGVHYELEVQKRSDGESHSNLVMI
jgi:hypothetical protein